MLINRNKPNLVAIVISMAIVFIGCVLTGVLLFGSSILSPRSPWDPSQTDYSAVGRARQQVKPGMSREYAVDLLSKQSWYYQPCSSKPISTATVLVDLFFFESHDYDKAEILILESRIDTTGFSVEGIWGFEPYAWQASYKNCIKREMFTP